MEFSNLRRLVSYNLCVLLLIFLFCSALILSDTLNPAWVDYFNYNNKDLGRRKTILLLFSVF